MGFLHDNFVTHTWHWAGSTLNDTAESISNGFTSATRDNAIKSKPNTLIKKNQKDQIALKDLPDYLGDSKKPGNTEGLSQVEYERQRQEALAAAEQRIFKDFSNLADRTYSVKWVDDGIDRCKGLLSFHRTVNASTAVAAGLAHKKSQNLKPGDDFTNLMIFLRVFPEASLQFTKKFKVGDKITFSLVKAVASSVLSGSIALRPEIISQGGSALAVLVGTMIKSNPDMRAYMRAFRDPQALDSRMLGQLREAK